MLTIKDIPNDAVQALERAFYANPKVIALRAKYNNLYNSHYYVEAANIQKQINELLIQCKQNYVDDYNKSKQTLSLSSAGLSNEELEKVTTLIMTLFVCCDVIESCQMDIESALHKVDPSMQFESFMGIRDIAKEVKKKIEFLYTDTTYMTPHWCSVCDNMYKMIKNKARSILRKDGQNPSKV